MIFSNYSTLSEMSQFFLDVEDMPTHFALCQRRKLLNPDIFKRINRLFLYSFDNYVTINGYHILAQDGSDINIPFIDGDTKITNNDLGIPPCCRYHINALYDCLNHTFLDWRIDTAQKKQETDALINIIYHSDYPQNTVFTADRGYENYNLIAHIIDNNLKFVILVKDINTKTGIMTNIQTPDGTFDINATRILTRLQTKEVKTDKKKDAFNKVKNTLGMIYFHAINRVLIQQDINTTFLMYNVSEVMINNIEINQKQNRRYRYKANFANAVTNIRLYLRNLLNEKNLVSSIKKFLIPERPERSYERSMKSKSVKLFNHRTS